ncbi:MAG: glucose PTS transporter subunit IIA [Lachnospiraceae bacterium]|nr:glucose PTS transporter subunit IIA [Lachnospiraceae bacterium]
MAKKEGGGGAFAVAQQIGKSLFLPIAVLPPAGILLGIGSSFTNSTTIATYGLSGILHPGTFLYGLMQMFAGAGNAVFGNLALIFALAVALGMAKKEKGVAVMSAGIFYLIMLTTMNVCLQISGQIVDGVIQEGVKEGAIAEVLGIQTLQMGVFGGILAGVLAGVLCNNFYKMQLPNALSFFAGTRFVPIVCMVGGIVVGALMFVVWPIIQSGIYALGGIVQSAGYFGTFIYGCIERALIPFGLHHIFYMPFWQTGVGGSMMIDGVLVEGAQNIFFAELASPNTTKFSVDAARFLVGKYPFMMGGLPGAALAMYSCARPEKKKEAGSLLFSVALTSFLTGVTEPIEFTFLFLAPMLFAIHVGFAGLSFAICHILKIAVGTTFSDGLIDLILYGVLPGQAKSNWLMLLPVIAAYFVLYFIVFRTFILKMDLKTPGREADDEEMHLVSKDEYRQATGVGLAGGRPENDGFAVDPKSAAILQGVGGVDNLKDIDCCATRLRLTLNDTSLVDEALLKSTGASGVVVKGNGIQVIYGPSVTIVKSNFEEFVEKVHFGTIVMPDKAAAAPAAEAPKAAREKTLADAVYAAHMNGQMKLMCEVEDETFAQCMLGDGVAVEPAEGKLYSPCDGRVESVFDTRHAVSLISKEGSEILLHIGIDTVQLGGKFFESHVKDGQEVKKGDLLVSFDMEAIKKAGYKVTTPFIICNTDDYSAVKPLKTGKVKAGENLLRVEG